MLALTQVDASTVNFVAKSAGKVVFTGSRAISKDGKEMTIASKGTNAAGKPFERTSVYDKR